MLKKLGETFDLNLKVELTARVKKHMVGWMDRK